MNRDGHQREGGHTTTLDPAVRDLLVAIRGALEGDPRNRFHVRSVIQTLLIHAEVGTVDLAWATCYLRDHTREGMA